MTFLKIGGSIFTCYKLRVFVAVPQQLRDSLNSTILASPYTGYSFRLFSIRFRLARISSP